MVEKGLISEDQLRIALQEQKKNRQPLGRLLVRLGFLSEATIRDVLSENLGQESVDLASVIVDPAAIKLIPKDIARRYQLIPLSVDMADKHLTLAIADPNNIIALDQVRALLKNEYRLITQRAIESDILRAIDQNYSHPKTARQSLNIHIARPDMSWRPSREYAFHRSLRQTYPPNLPHKKAVHPSCPSTSPGSRLIRQATENNHRVAVDFWQGQLVRNGADRYLP